MERNKVIDLLFSKQDHKLQKFHSGLCPGIDNIIGVRTPELRKMAKEIVKNDWQKFLHENQDEYYEETLLTGLVIAGVKIDLTERLELLQDFVPKIDNWATCDLVCNTFRFKPEQLAEVWKFILEYRNSPQEFERRFTIVMMMDHFLLPEYIERVFQILDESQTAQYYVQMASAWLVATAFVKFRNETLTYLQKNHLGSWTQNKAIQKIRESYRVDRADKELVLQYKR